MKDRPRKITLPGGHTVMVRQPAVQEDLERLMAFFGSLPAEQRNYLRYDTTGLEHNRKRLQEVDGTNHFRVVADLDGHIVGDGTLDRLPFGWTRHVGEVRVAISPELAETGVGLVLLNELVELGSAAGIERLVSESIEGDQERISMLSEAGFVREAVLKRHVKDLMGFTHDLVVLTIDLEEAWRNLADQLVELDIRGPRSA
jgi:L-amino acid N-acyltransferase YncA